MSVDGILGRKIGMTQLHGEDGAVEAVTALRAGPCTVTQVKSIDDDGYSSVQLGYDEAKRANKPARGHLAAALRRRTRRDQTRPHRVGGRLARRGGGSPRRVSAVRRYAAPLRSGSYLRILE